MKIFIHTDLEGVCDFYDWAEADIPTSRGIGYTKEFLTAEINAAIEGVCSVYPEAEFVVEDGHGGGYMGPNIICEKLDSRAKLLVGKFARHLNTVDESFDLLMIIGAHSMAGTQQGLMNHTLSKDKFYNVALNGRPVGEIGICTAIAGYYGIPLVMVAGDYWAAVEAKQLVENVRTAAVKRGLSSYCAECLHPDEARKLIFEAAADAVKQKDLMKPFKLEDTLEVQIDYLHTEQADDAKQKGGGKRVGSRTVLFTGSDLRELFDRCFV